MNERGLLLLVEDDAALRERLTRAFVARGLEVVAVATIADAQTFLSEDVPELAVVDLRVSDGSGLDLIHQLKQADPATRIVVLTGYGSIATAVEALRRGAANYLTKPADADAILSAFDPPSSPPEAAPV